MPELTLDTIKPELYLSIQDLLEALGCVWYKQDLLAEGGHYMHPKAKFIITASDIARLGTPAEVVRYLRKREEG